MKAFFRSRLSGQLEGIVAASAAVPKAVVQASLDAFATAPSVLQQVHGKSCISVASRLGSAVLTKAQVVAPSADDVAHLLQGGALKAAASGAVSGVEAANDIFSALRLQVRIVHPDSPNARISVRFPPVEGSAFGDDAEVAGGSSTTARRMTPRQFVLLMRDARRSGDLGDGVASYVKNLTEAGGLEPIPLLSKQFQQKLYVDIARIMVFTFQRGFLTLDDASLWGHTLKVSSTPSLGPFSSKTKRQGSVGNEQLQAVVDQMLKSEAVRMPWLPRTLERRLYINCMTIVFQLVEDLLAGDGEEISFMGHTLKFEFEAQPLELLKQILEEQPITHCRINEPVLDELVDELLADEETNLYWMPDVIESQLYISVMKLMIRMAEHIIGHLKMSILGRQIKMSIMSTIDLEARKEFRKGKSAEATVYYEEEDPFKTVSTTELEERLKDLDEQRRVLVALQELGGAEFDFTAESPMVQEVSPMDALADSVNDATAQEEHPISEDKSNVRRPIARAVSSDGQEVHEFHRMAHTVKLGRSLSLKCEIDADIEVPHGMIADVETYPLWMPWCTSGQFMVETPGSTAAETSEGHPQKPREQVFRGKVGFGFETGTFLGTVGDTVNYRVSVRAPASTGGQAGHGPTTGRVTADAVDGFTYGKRLIYDWRFLQLGPKKTKVELDMFFEARSVLYMPVWDSMQTMVVNNMLQAFKARAVEIEQERIAARSKAPTPASPSVDK